MQPRALLSLAALSVTASTVALPAQQNPWLERAELELEDLGPAPTTGERLADAEILLVKATDVGVGPGGWTLRVDPWTRVPGFPTYPDICPAEDFYAQPQPHDGGCSGFLVAPDLVITAGHCVRDATDPDTRPPYPCTDRYVVFDFADLAGPVQTEEWLSIPDPVVQCETVEIDTRLGDDSAFEELPAGGTPGPDWALLRLVQPVTDRLPLVIERFPQTDGGEAAVALGHPARIPLKAELTTAAASNGVTIHALGGSSGTPLISLETGKVFANVTNAGADAYDWVVDLGVCTDLCFECAGGSFTGSESSAWTPFLDPVGLQATIPAGSVVHYYGPPGSATNFTTWGLGLSAPDDPLDLAPDIVWSVEQEDPGADGFEVTEGPSSGTLSEGQSTGLVMRPADWLVSDPGVFERTVPVFDWTYGTRDPVVHRAHVGVDGYGIVPDSPFDGEGLGVEHATLRRYRLTNRWIVGQDVAVSFEPDDPGDPPWLDLSETQVFLPPLQSGAPLPAIVDATTDGTGMLPGVYTGEITFESLQSPGDMVVHAVRFDHCREIFEDEELPASYTLDPDEPPTERTLTVAPTGPTTITDVDVIVEIDTGSHLPPYSVALRAPDGTEVLLKDFDQPAQTYYDDETTAPPSGDLFDFDGGDSQGTWTLILEAEDGSQPFPVTLGRLEVRLHHENAQPCE